MLRRAILAIATKYLDAKKQDFAGHPMAAYLRTEVPELLCSISPDSARYRYVGSAGKGRWADCPWVAVLDPIVTTSPLRGFYLVYLFSHDMQVVYLSLNQGVTDLVEAYGTSTAAQLLRSQAQSAARFLQSGEPIYVLTGELDLRVKRHNWRSEKYEAGSIVALKYETGALPDNRTLVADFRGMLELYGRLSLGGPIAFAGPMSISTQDLASTGSPYSARRLHWAADRNLSELVRGRRQSRCEVCLVDLGAKYGAEGARLIEGHCLLGLEDVESYTDPERVRSSYAAVCPTCHRFLHAARDPADLDGAISDVSQDALWPR